MNDRLDFPFDARSGLRRWSGVRMLTGKLTVSSAASCPSISATASASTPVPAQNDHVATMAYLMSHVGATVCATTAVLCSPSTSAAVNVSV